jgi:hypothetical protein
MSEEYVQEKQALFDYRFVIPEFLEQNGWGKLEGKSSLHDCYEVWTLNGRTLNIHCPETIKGCKESCEFRLAFYYPGEAGEFSWRAAVRYSQEDEHRFLWREGSGGVKEKMIFYPTLEEWEEALKSSIRGDAVPAR